MRPKAISLVVALLLFGLGTLSAAPLDGAALERAHRFVLAFKSGEIKQCTVLEFTDGAIWLVLKMNDTSAYLDRLYGVNSTDLDFNDMEQMSLIKRILMQPKPSDPACVIFN
jgi:hypothetical protein